MRCWERIRKSVVELRGLALIGIADVISNLISGLFWIYLASLIGDESYGKLSYSLALCGIASTISLIGASNTITVYASKNNEIVSSLYLISLIIGVVVTMLVFFIVDSYEISVYVLSSIIFGLAVAEILGRRLYKEYLILAIIQKILMVCLSIVLYYSIGINGVILGLGVSFLPYSIIAIRVLRRPKIQLTSLRRHVGFIINNFIISLSGLLNSSMDKMIIGPLFGFVVLGNYQLALQFLVIFQTMPIVVYKYILSHGNLGDFNRKLKKITVLISIGIAITGITLSPTLVPVFFSKFSHLINLLQILSVSLIPISVSYIYGSHLLANEKSKVVLIGTILFFISYVILLYILGVVLKQYTIGIAISYVVSTIIQSLFLFIANKRIKYDISN